MPSEKRVAGYVGALLVGIEALVAGIVYDFWIVWVGGIVLLLAGLTLWWKGRSLGAAVADAEE